MGNAYLNSSASYRYIRNSTAVRYEASGGEHRWYNAASGTADAAISFTQAMTLDADGDLGIGTTTPRSKLDVNGNAYVGASGSSVSFVLAGDTTTTGGFIYEDNTQMIISQITAAPIIFRTTNTERARIDSSGNLLVGTTTAAGKLTVVGANISDGATAKYIANIRNSGAQTSGIGAGIAFTQTMSSFNAVLATIQGIKENGTSDNYASSLSFYTRANGADLTEKARIDSSGNLLVGATSSSNALDVQRSSGNVIVNAQATANTTRAYYQTGAKTGAGTAVNGYFASIGDAATVELGSTSSHALAFLTNNAERVRIDTSGNLGIGTSSPATTLDVQGALPSAQVLATTGTNRVWMRVNNTGGDFYFGRENSAGSSFGTTAYSALLWSQGAYPMVFATNNTERARINSSGDVLVNTTDANLNAGVGIKLRSSATIPVVGVVGSDSTDSNSGYTLYSTGAAAYRFFVTYGGTINATSIVITAISDQRLKENIRDIDTGLNAIMALKPRRFDWKDGKGQDKKNAAGFIAQEFEDVFPECVSTSMAGEDGIEYKNINHETLIPTLVKAMQEQQAIIESLKARLDAANL
jgi:hypothetical protein